MTPQTLTRLIHWTLLSLVNSRYTVSTTRVYYIYPEQRSDLSGCLLLSVTLLDLCNLRNLLRIYEVRNQWNKLNDPAFCPFLTHSHICCWAREPMTGWTIVMQSVSSTAGFAAVISFCDKESKRQTAVFRVADRFRLVELAWNPGALANCGGSQSSGSS